MISTLILITINTVLYLGAFLLLIVGFQTTQWATFTESCGCPGSCVFYIGLWRERFTKLYKCGEKSKDIDCDVLALSDDDCKKFESSREAAQIAIALVVVLLVWKIIVNGFAFKSLQEKKRVLWILFLLATIGDIVVGFAAFISAGQFDAVEDWNVVDVNTGKSVHFSQGYGWQCFIGGGGIAWIVAVLGAFTLWRGFTQPEEPVPSSPTIEENAK